MNKKNSKFSKVPDKSPIIALLSGAVAGAIVCSAVFAILLFIGTAFAMKSPDPSSLYFTLGIGISVISAFIGGITAAKFTKDAEIVSSLICGVILSLAAFLLGIFICRGDDSTLSSFVFLLFPVICLLGGFIGKPKKIKKKKFSNR